MKGETQKRLPRRRPGEIDAKNPGYKEQYGVIVLCPNEAQQRAVYEQLREQGHILKVVTV